jgi:hypothetical protein
MRARACLKCKQYVVIHPDNPINLNTVKEFEKKHGYHTIITIDLNEVKENNFTNVESSIYKNSVKVNS